jgi:FkbM family methyltransferase
MSADKVPFLVRGRWKLAHTLWPERLRPDKLLTRWRLRACEAEAIARWCAAAGPEAGLPRPEARSQTGEDALLWDLLGDREHGFFVEAGAYDGYTFSVSYLFECVGWTGVLVEPLADRAAECAERRPASHVVNAALSRHGSGATATFERNAAVEWESRLAPGGSGGAVPLVTLDDVLEGHADSIDFVVLDVEGHELAALEGFDLQRWKPTALLIENNEDESAVRRHVEAHAYAHVGSLAQNDLFIHRDELALAHRLEHHWDDVGTF